MIKIKYITICSIAFSAIFAMSFVMPAHADTGSTTDTTIITATGTDIGGADSNSNSNLSTTTATLNASGQDIGGADSNSNTNLSTTTTIIALNASGQNIGGADSSSTVDTTASTSIATSTALTTSGQNIGGADSSTTATTNPVTITDSSGATTANTVGSESGGGYFSGGGNEYTAPVIATALPVTGISSTTSSLFCPLMTDYVIPGRVNNPEDISKIQTFFNVNDNADLAVNGILDTATINAIKSFQGKYLSEIMGPWDSTAPSGQAYITTVKKINQISCDTSLTLNAEELGIINTYKAEQLTLAQNAGSTTAVQTANSNGIGALLTIPEAHAAVITPTSTDNSALTGNAINATAANSNLFSRIFSTIASWFK
jgi:hypothetical protein